MFNEEMLMGGFHIFNEANHADYGNPHPQYCGTENWKRIEGLVNLDNSHYRMAQISLLDSDTRFVLGVELVCVSAYHPTQTCKFLLKCAVAGTIAAGTRYNNLALISQSGNFDTTNVYGTVVDNGASGVVIALYFKVPNTSQEWWWRPFVARSIQPKRRYTLEYPGLLTTGAVKNLIMA